MAPDCKKERTMTEIERRIPSGRTTVKKVVLVWNVLALLIIAGLWGYSNRAASLGAPSRVAALDRAGVIDEAKLRESYPSFTGSNLRGGLGRWIAEDERRSASMLALAGAVTVFVNVCLVGGTLVTGMTTRKVSADDADE
jgi:hypothetical protein